MRVYQEPSRVSSKGKKNITRLVHDDLNFMVLQASKPALS